MTLFIFLLYISCPLSFNLRPVLPSIVLQIASLIPLPISWVFIGHRWMHIKQSWFQFNKCVLYYYRLGVGFFERKCVMSLSVFVCLFKKVEMKFPFIHSKHSLFSVKFGLRHLGWSLFFIKRQKYPSVCYLALMYIFYKFSKYLGLQMAILCNMFKDPWTCGKRKVYFFWFYYLSWIIHSF